MSEMSIHVVAQNTCHTVGESPVWLPASQSVLYVDLKAGDVHVWDSNTGQDTKIHIEGDMPVGFIIPRQSGGYVAAVGRALCMVDLEACKVTSTLGEVEQGSNNRFNDGKCDPSGRIWAGTMGPDDPPGSGKFLPNLGSLYSFDPSDPEGIKKHLSGLTISNGMAWTSDAKTMYFIDTPARKVYAFDYDQQAGTIANQQVTVDFDDVGPTSEIGSPDGMCLDSEDNLWVACFGGGRVINFSSTTGQVIRQILFPEAKQITCCAFGGPDYSDLYVTCGRVRLSEEEFTKRQPQAGSLFRVTGLGVKGLPVFTYKG